jgi:hypothetical protein
MKQELFKELIKLLRNCLSVPRNSSTLGNELVNIFRNASNIGTTVTRNVYFFYALATGNPHPSHPRDTRELDGD